MWGHQQCQRQTGRTLFQKQGCKGKAGNPAGGHQALEWVLLFVSEPCIVYKLSHSAYPEMKNEELITVKELEF